MPSNAKKHDLPPERKKPTVHNFRDISEETFGRLSVLYYVGRIAGKPSWACRCSCGRKVVVPSKQLFRKQTRSCGCLMIDRTREANLRHGCKGTKIYRIWTGMLTRCRNPNSKDYPRYGGRGIVVCERWTSFKLFLADMGHPPKGDYTIERVDNDKGYEPSNCTWIKRERQASNRCDSVVVTVNGVTKTAVEWDRANGFRIGTVSARMRRGWKAVDAVLTPVNKNLSRSQKKETSQ